MRPVGEVDGIGVFLARHPNRKDDLFEVVIGPASCSECEVVATLPTTRAGKTEAIRISMAILRTLDLISSINDRPPV
ncbi:hypothetical protein [Methylobacterium nodulans]|uniref:hypothetical protein n=1 Tax=Methylobacterium nodulans TaxID=114616 RepID=UPI0005C1C242|nr:hypothetical protein [Methylobacterium nodulans]